MPDFRAKGRSFMSFVASLVLIGTVLAATIVLGLIFVFGNENEVTRMEVIPDDAVIMFNSRESSSFQPFVEKLNAEVQWVEEANTRSSGKDVINCKFGHSRANESHACVVKSSSSLGQCSWANSFGFRYGDPCILIKLKHMYGWIPERYGAGKEYNDFDYLSSIEGAQAVKRFPLDLLKRVKLALNQTTEKKAKEAIASSVWLHCHGNGPFDKESIGAIDYYPEAYFPSFYFPYLGQEKYVDPFVMIHLRRIMVGVLITVKCTAYASNIPTNEASVEFNLLMD